jgi:hypothetical protein
MSSGSRTLSSNAASTSATASPITSPRMTIVVAIRRLRPGSPSSGRVSETTASDRPTPASPWATAI